MALLKQQQRVEFCLKPPLKSNARHTRLHEIYTYIYIGDKSIELLHGLPTGVVSCTDVVVGGGIVVVVIGMLFPGVFVGGGIVVVVSLLL